MASLTDGHESEQTLGAGDGQGSLECCSPWGCKESDTTERRTELRVYFYFFYLLGFYCKESGHKEP